MPFALGRRVALLEEKVLAVLGLKETEYIEARIAASVDLEAADLRANLRFQFQAEREKRNEEVKTVAERIMAEINRYGGIPARIGTIWH